MELREISHYLRSCKLSIGNYLDKMEKNHSHFIQEERYYCFMYVIPIMIALRTVNPERYQKFITGQDGSPLIEVSEYIGEGFFSNLLESNESFSPVSAESKVKAVTVADKLNKLYDALFCTDYRAKVRYRKIGQVQLSEQTQQMLSQVMSSLSKFSLLHER